MSRWTSAVLFVAILFGAPPVIPSLAQAAPNTIPLTVRAALGGFNRLLVGIRICGPGTTDCATIDDVMVDTGSTGLRLNESALPSALRLPAFRGADGAPEGECLRFVRDAAWGDLVRADLHIGGLVAADLPIEVLHAGTQPHPASCPASTTPPTANGTLGISPLRTDCVGDCRQDPSVPVYFTCGSDGCRPIDGVVAPPYRLPNPVLRLADHNNGVIFDLPPAPDGGAASLAGYLTFGIGPDDIKGAPATLTLNALGFFTTRYDGRAYPDSLIDSGDGTNVVPDGQMPLCADALFAFCVVPTRRLAATMVGRDGATIPMAFAMGDYDELQRRHPGADASLSTWAPMAARSFVWGAPFFFGRRIALIPDGASVAGGLEGPAWVPLRESGVGADPTHLKSPLN